MSFAEWDVVRSGLPLEIPAEVSCRYLPELEIVAVVPSNFVMLMLNGSL
jgi:hypothetical protein